MLDAGGAPEMEVKAYGELMNKYKDRLKNKDLVMLFVETLPMQMDALKAGISHGQVGQRPFEMGYKAMYMLNDLTQGKSVAGPGHHRPRRLHARDRGHLQEELASQMYED